MNGILSFFLLTSMEETMLLQAQKVSSTYAQEIAKATPPKSHPTPDKALAVGSVWFTVDHNDVDQLEWSLLRDLGTESVQVKNIRKKGWLGINPSLEASWQHITKNAKNESFSLIGTVLGNASAAGSDFEKALKNTPSYQNLYHLIEIDREDWKLLPKVPAGSSQTNVPWLDLQTLFHKGYVPEKFAPYVKQTSWDTTDVICGHDGKERRWIYLKNGANYPVFDFLSSSFTAYQLLTADALKLCKQAGTNLLEIDGELPLETQNMLSLWIRKIGGFSASNTDGTITSLQKTTTDLTYDIATRPALLHALVTQDAEALRMIYHIFLQAKIDTKKLVHVLQPFDEHIFDWKELTNNSKHKFLYHEQQVTGEILKNRLLKEDLMRLGPNPSSWVESCARALKIKDFVKHKNLISNAHLLLAFTYAMQPGVFSFSYDDLLGTLPQSQDGPKYLYSDLSFQMKTPHSFARGLQKILQARAASNIKQGELIDILPSPNPGTLLLLYRLPITRQIQLLAVNFANKEADEFIERSEIIKTNAIDLMTSLMEEKVFQSNAFSFTLPPMSGKAFLFLSREYD